MDWLGGLWRDEEGPAGLGKVWRGRARRGEAGGASRGGERLCKTCMGQARPAWQGKKWLGGSGNGKAGEA